MLRHCYNLHQLSFMSENYKTIPILYTIYFSKGTNEGFFLHSGLLCR